MKITYFGTTMLMFDDGTEQILSDCHVTRPSMIKYAFGKLKTNDADAEKVIRDFRMDRLSAMFISHSHHDHAMDIPYFAQRCGCKVYGSGSTLNIARGGGVPEEQLKLFASGEIYGTERFKVTVLKSIHSKPTRWNNDLGQTIEEPLHQPAAGKAYKEGGSYDFLIGHKDGKYLVRPSYNFIPGQLDGIEADVLFLGIAGLSKDDEAHKKQFFDETLGKVHPKLVIPLHWDNFFKPLYGSVKGMPKLFEDTGKSMHELAKECSKRNISCMVQLPLTSISI